jgi:hypothetical protein
MIDLTSIDQETLIARGQYSTVRGAHEDEKQRLAILCGQLSTISSQVLRAMQPDRDAAPDMGVVNELLATGREALARIEQCVGEIEGLGAQRAALKVAAWGRK